MNPVGVALLWVFGFMVAASLSSSCGGQTGSNNANQGGLAGTGGRTAAGGAISLGTVHNTGGEGGASTSVDAGASPDAGQCSPQLALSSICRTSDCCPFDCGTTAINAANIINCALQLSSSPQDPTHLPLLVNCIALPKMSGWNTDAGTPTDIDGWSIDYSVQPARLVFGATLCEQIQVQGNVSIYLFSGCSGIC